MSNVARIWVLRAAPALTAALAIGGIGIASYLSYVHYAHQSIACGGLGSCETVNSSKYAELMGVPVALLGGVVYVVLLLVAVRWFLAGPYLAAPAAWAISLGGFLFSVYLTYLELFVIDSICIWCVASACVLTAALVVTSTALPAALSPGEGEEEEDEREEEAERPSESRRAADTP